jgi:tRNA(Arg) A34 adenosine deaminase TadA
MSSTTAATPGPRDEHFMEIALGLAETAVARGQTPFGAVVVDRSGRLIGEGHNAVRADRDPTAHGEIVAIRAAWRTVGAWPLLAGSTLYSSCEPCLLCSFVIAQIGIGRVVFAARGTDVPTYRPLLGADLTQAAAWVNAQPGWSPLEIVGDFMRERALATIAAFPWTQAQARTTIDRPG